MLVLNRICLKESSNLKEVVEKRENLYKKYRVLGFVCKQEGEMQTKSNLRLFSGCCNIISINILKFSFRIEFVVYSTV